MSAIAIPPTFEQQRRNAERVKAAAGKHTYIYPNRVRFIKKLSEQYTVELNTKSDNSDNDHVRARKIDKEDVFYATHIRWSILPIDFTTADGETKTHGQKHPVTWEDPNFFKEFHTTFAGCWNGSMEIKIGGNSKYERLGLEKFRCVPEYQSITGRNVADSADVIVQTPIISGWEGFIELPEIQGFKGDTSNEIIVKFQKPTGAGFLADMSKLGAATLQYFYGCIELEGFYVVDGNLK